VVGLGVHTPFGLGTAWKDQAAWVGRYVSVDSEIQMFGINPTVAMKVNDKLSVGVGVDVRLSSVNVEQHVEGSVLSPMLAGYDVATVALESDMNNKIGFNFGLLYALNEKMNLGLAYRSGVKIEYTGSAEFAQVLTGNGTIDAMVAAGLPADPVDVETAIDYPGVFTAGLAYQLKDNLLVEGDIQYWFWSVFKELSISGLPTGDVTIDENYEDAFEFRLGLEWWRTETMALRAGFVHDQTPVPKESISPMLPDASRNGITGGVGLKFGSMTVDAAFMYLMFADAETADTMATGYPIGTYKNSALLFAIDLGFAIGR
jgi:long-chain fatty acid transport protein